MRANLKSNFKFTRIELKYFFTLVANRGIIYVFCMAPSANISFAYYTRRQCTDHRRNAGIRNLPKAQPVLNFLNHFNSAATNTKLANLLGK
jgi:hypothetical protein